jgi:hypothetical protein
MQTMHKTQATLGALLALGLPALAGPVAASAPSNNGDFCSWWSGRPFQYKNSSNKFLQELRFEGRYQYQVGYVDGSDVNGDDFSSTYDEHRRFRLGFRTKIADYFSTKMVLNLVNDGRPNGGALDWGYQDFDEALVSFDLHKAVGGIGALDSLTLNFGREKFVLSREARTSSNNLLTVERSGLSNKVYGSARPTGFSADAKMADWSFYGALFSAGREGGNNGFIGSLDSSMIYLGSVGYKVNDLLDLRFDAVYNDSDFGADSDLGYRWATSISADYNTGPWGVIADVIIGDNGDADNGVGNVNRQDNFWGLVVMPYAWIIEDKLQGVFQYQYANSSASEGLRVNSRYGRAGKNAPANVNGGRGDQHHSLYAGLNYYLCGHNAKIQAGIEYQNMDTPAGDFDTLTYLLAFRTFF